MFSQQQADARRQAAAAQAEREARLAGRTDAPEDEVQVSEISDESVAETAVAETEAEVVETETTETPETVEN